MAVLYLSTVDPSAEIYEQILPRGFLAGSLCYKREEDRARSLCCRYLLFEHLKKEGLHPEEDRILWVRGEKPALEKTPLQFSFSHSGRLSAVLVDESFCGVDVELVRMIDADRLAARMLLEKDLEAFLSAPDKNVRFIELFTKMEAKGKYMGTGLVHQKVALADLSEVKTKKAALGEERYCLSYLAKKEPQIVLTGEGLFLEE